MVLSNAERQARYLARLKERASGAALSAMAVDAADKAVVALWEYLSRQDDQGRADASLDGIADLEAFRLSIAQSDDGLVGFCQDILRHPDDLTVDQAAAMNVVVEVADALELASYRASA